MQIFRAQLSRYTPHPHRDSWMRNNHDRWLHWLRVCSFLTLFSAGWLCLFFSSPVGNACQLSEQINRCASALGVESAATLSRWIMQILGGFLMASALLSFRCGQKRQRNKYHYPVLISGVILLACALLGFYQSQYAPLLILPLLLPISTPFMLLTYQRWQNKLDHWNSLLSIIIAITLLGNALQFLLHHGNPSHTPVKALEIIGIGGTLSTLIILAVSYTATAAAIGLFIPTLRRPALYIIITLGILTLISHLVANIGHNTNYFDFTYWLADILFFSSYWLLPMLILLSLASRRKNQTLRL